MKLTDSQTRGSAEMQTRGADPVEFDALVRLWMSGWEDGHAGLLPPELVRLRTPEDFRMRMRKMYRTMRIVGPVGDPQGFHNVKDDELDQLYVAAGSRGTGLASALLADAESHLVAGGTRIAWLACAIGNERAARFYEKHGWRRAGVVTHHPDTPEGPVPLQVWRYEKQVAPA